ncbi:alpha/beta hydrolase [Galbitalea sp. SE-J8]|uniref:alpha/beta hydrolase n=1 Tax=Galbitalea sp. SE-J8 TaxID=3054952 RepID=UPI00259C9B6A|nr:alpha/beta hydrolase [Galbitalea sp. SE-J8]MDM4761568.1 alpha/beta hydrolase [Galbitalea sp. SE-J8]
MNEKKAPIVLIHGLWMTPKSWDTWAERFRAAGHEVIAPAWPGIGDRTPAEVRHDPSALAGVGLAEIADYYEGIIRALPEKPIIMGHSFGGVITQMLADRGLGVAYVGVTPGQTAGVTTLPPSTARTGFPILSKPWTRNGTTPISTGHFRFTFGNDLSHAASDRIWAEQAIPSYNRVFFEGVAAAFNEKGGVTHVDYDRTDRAPLLIITGGIDHVVPPAIGEALVKKYRRAGGPSVVDYREFAGRTHRIVSQDGWEEVADFALDWATSHAAVSA